jgi:hypothetical protein
MPNTSPQPPGSGSVLPLPLYKPNRFDWPWPVTNAASVKSAVTRSIPVAGIASLEGMSVRRRILGNRAISPLFGEGLPVRDVVRVRREEAGRARRRFHRQGGR